MASLRDTSRYAVPFATTKEQRAVIARRPAVAATKGAPAGEARAESDGSSGRDSAAAAPKRRRQQGKRRSRTISMRELSRQEIIEGAELADLLDYERPRTRAECIGGIRPCPFVSCRYHLYLEVNPSGSIKLNFPDIDVTEMKESCALDVADRGGTTLEEIGELLNLTRERVRQLEGSALGKLRDMGLAEAFLGIPDDPSSAR